MDFTNVAKALTARGFKVSSFETAKEAAEYLNSQIDGATVGFGGSITLEELGLYALLSGHNTVFSHWHLPEGGDAAALRAQGYLPITEPAPAPACGGHPVQFFLHPAVGMIELVEGTFPWQTEMTEI